MIFIDTNVLIDIIAPGQRWRDWSFERIDCLGSAEPLAINSIVLAELASGFATLAQSLEWLGQMGIEVRTLSDEAAFDGGLAFRRYRAAAAHRSSVLADFLIGAHAYELRAALLTRDSTIYRRYFPDLALITPETHPYG